MDPMSADAALRDDPLHGLAGQLGDALEVGVVVQQREAGRFGARSDQQIGQRDGTMLGARRQQRLTSSARSTMASVMTTRGSSRNVAANAR